MQETLTPQSVFDALRVTDARENQRTSGVEQEGRRRGFGLRAWRASQDCSLLRYGLRAKTVPHPQLLPSRTCLPHCAKSTRHERTLRECVFVFGIENVENFRKVGANLHNGVALAH